MEASLTLRRVGESGGVIGEAEEAGLVWSDSRWSVLLFFCGALCFAILSCAYQRLKLFILGTGLLQGKRR